jgi:NIMA (never in mitosis gene a)-related kinase 2
MNQSDYKVLNLIGTPGSNGKVSKIQRISDKKLMVWKEISYGEMNMKEKNLLVSEVNLLKKLKNPHIVSYYEKIIDKNEKKFYLIMEYCEEGDLANIIHNYKKNKKEFSEEIIWKILSQLCIALSECHNYSEGIIIHRDIKPGKKKKKKN